MATLADVRRIALALPGTQEEDGPQPAFAVPQRDGALKGFAWSWRERVDPKKTKVVNREVLVVPVNDEAEKQILIAGDPEVFFTEPHYNGYAAVLVRLPAIRVPALRKLLSDAHAIIAAKGKGNAKRAKPRPRRTRAKK